jgi:hypothetical protein
MHKYKYIKKRFTLLLELTENKYTRLLIKSFASATLRTIRLLVIALISQNTCYLNKYPEK